MAEDLFRIEVKGLEQLAAKFQLMETQLDHILEQATAAGAAVVIREAAINARKGGDEFPHRITGNLIRTLTIIRKKSSPGRCEMQAGTDAEYGPRLEFGFNDVDKLGRRIHQRPRPFLRPALDEHTDEIQEEFENAIRKLEEMFNR